MHAGRTETASEERFRECFFRLAESSLFNLCGWIVSIKKTAAKSLVGLIKIRPVGFIVFIWSLVRFQLTQPVRELLILILIEKPRQQHHLWMAAVSRCLQVYQPLRLTCGEACSRVSSALRAAEANKLLFTYRVKHSKLGFDMTVNIIRQTVCL